jgi:molybdate transport system substrate-binding protein
MVPSPHRRHWPTAALALALGFTAAPVVAQSPSPASAPPPGTSASLAPSCPPGEPVFAAASLTNALEDLGGPWTAAHPGSDLILTFDASSALRAQVEEGAIADVFVSADTKNAQAIVDGCLAPGPIVPFAGNSLVIVVPTGNPAGIETPADLAASGVRVVAAGPEVPISGYARQVIANLAALPDYPSGFASAVAANTVSEEDNVRAVLAKIQLGEGDVAIVYVTDAASSDDVQRVAIPDGANVLAAYAAVAVGSATQLALATEFLAFLLGPEAQGVLAGHGFLPPPAP